MRTLATLALVSITMSSVAMADHCCKPAGCSPDRNCLPGCKPVVKKVDIKATCYNTPTNSTGSVSGAGGGPVQFGF